MLTNVAPPTLGHKAATRRSKGRRRGRLMDDTRNPSDRSTGPSRGQSDETAPREEDAGPLDWTDSDDLDAALVDQAIADRIRGLVEAAGPMSDERAEQLGLIFGERWFRPPE